jgi:epoxyqueuosine reductase
MNKLKHDISAYARSLGFGRIGISAAVPMESAEKSLGAWLENGCAGTMDYMEKNWQTRARPGAQLPGARSVISLAVSYYDASPSPQPSPLEGERETNKSPRPLGGEVSRRPATRRKSWRGQGEGRIARYAWGKDYHKVIEKRLDSLVRYIEALVPDARCKTYLDTGPLLERAAAQRSGLGFIGKNTMLITRGLGSWVFLASVVTTLDLPADEPDNRTCGSCTLCIDACPTQALTGPYHLDARRCIAYLTIESKDVVPVELRSQTKEWLFGCDVCQEVCPHNTRVEPAAVADLTAAAGLGPSIDLKEILAIENDAEFDQRFMGTPLRRSKRHGLIRNACLSAAQQNRTDLLPRLETLARKDPHPVVREHARWAADRLSHGNIC